MFFLAIFKSFPKENIEKADTRFKPRHAYGLYTCMCAQLHSTCVCVFLSTAEKILKQGVEPNISNADGLTPLHKVSSSITEPPTRYMYTIIACISNKVIL